jgi:hypothetical protein
VPARRLVRAEVDAAGIERLGRHDPRDVLVRGRERLGPCGDPLEVVAQGHLRIVDSVP